MSDCNLACGDECTKDTCPVFKAYKQGRADAIDEFVKVYKTKTSMEHKLIDEIVEQLKEKVE